MSSSRELSRSITAPSKCRVPEANGELRRLLERQAITALEVSTESVEPELVLALLAATRPPAPCATSARDEAWKTRRAKYGDRGHSGSYTRRGGDPVGRRALALVLRLHEEEALSEGQCCKALDLDRVAFRALADGQPCIACGGSGEERWRGARREEIGLCPVCSEDPNSPELPL